MRLPTIVLALVACVVSVGLALLVANLFGANSKGSSTAFQPLPTVVTTSVAASTDAPPVSTSTSAPASTAVAVAATMPATLTPSIVAVATTRPTATSNPTAAATATATATSKPAVAPSATAQEAYIEYTVKRGDSLLRIARTYNVTAKEILALNTISNVDSLTVGQVLRIPRAK